MASHVQGMTIWIHENAFQLTLAYVEFATLLVIRKLSMENILLFLVVYGSLFVRLIKIIWGSLYSHTFNSNGFDLLTIEYYLLFF